MNKFTDTRLGKSLSYLGVTIGFVGMTHGIPEILQGESLVASNNFNAFPHNWPNKDMFELLQGQPAVTILTDIPFYMLGILAMLASSAIIVFSAYFLNSKRNLLAFFILNTAVLLFGAGGGNPVLIGIPVLVTVLISKYFGKRKRRADLSDVLNLKLNQLFLRMHILSWFLLFPGIFILDALGVRPDALFYIAVVIMPVSVLGVLVFGYRYDNTLRSAG